MENKKKKKEGGRGIFELTAKAVLVKDEKVLILKRSSSDNRYPGKYDLPGGTIERGESAREGLSREIREELGVEAEIGPIINIVDFGRENAETGEEEFGKGLRFLAFWKSGEISLSSEHQEFEWLSFEEAAGKFEERGFEREKKETVLLAKRILELEDSLNGWQRCRADFENYKKRQEESRRELVAFANENMILEILPILDNFYASTEHIPEDQKNHPWVVGIMHIQKQLEKVLEDGGVSEIPVSSGKDFDPREMEAVKQEEEDGQKKKGKVEEVFRKGYRMGGRVIRPARVSVK